MILRGHSMRPSLKNGDLLEPNYLGEPMNISELDVGQVVLTRSGGEWVVHRVVENHRGEKVTKGDWSTCFDESQQAWALIEKVNENQKSILNDSTMAKWSSDLAISGSRGRRWLRRLQMVFRSWFV